MTMTNIDTGDNNSMAIINITLILINGGEIYCITANMIIMYLLEWINKRHMILKFIMDQEFISLQQECIFLLDAIGGM